MTGTLRPPEKVVIGLDVGTTATKAVAFGLGHPAARRRPRVRITGGAFRLALWRDVMEATLDKPMQAVGDAEGSALGAAALGLHAVGLSPRLEDAPAMLGVARSPDDLRVEPDPSLVSVYADARMAVPRLVAALGAVAGLFGTADRIRGKSRPDPAEGVTSAR